MSNFFNFINAHTWAAVLFMLLCIVIFFAALIGLMLLCCNISWAIEARQINNLEKKYPELFVKIREHSKVQEKYVQYYSKYILPIKEKIDELVQDNYLQVEEKSKQLRVLRDEYARHYSKYKLIFDKGIDLKEEINNTVKEIYKTDKKITKAWNIKKEN